MIDQATIDGIRRRGKKFTHLLAAIESGHVSVVKDLQRKLEHLQAEVNAASAVIPSLSAADKKAKIAAMKPLSDEIAHLKKQLNAATDVILPNTPRPDVPPGDDERGNVVLREVGSHPKLTSPKHYLDLVEPLGYIDVKRAAKVSGSRFGYLFGPLAEMEFALIQYAQSLLLREGFIMTVPPVMIKEENMAAMGYLHGGGEDETYHFAKDRLYLVGTSEQSIGPLHRDEIFEATDLPRRYLSFSTCFRREAGSYGRDTKGILRVHQFDKLEMFSITTADASDDEHAFLLQLEERLWQGLRIPYRVLTLCAGDLGWPSARTYDIEAWLPGQGEYREVSSTSTTTDYQAKNLGIKVRRNGVREYVHMLNGTAFAIGRTLIAIIENYQRPNGTIAVPKVLQPFMGKRKVIG